MESDKISFLFSVERYSNKRFLKTFSEGERRISSNFLSMSNYEF